ncbi:helix-turn-helix transcriptional regulator [Acrocarpospora catenulata]|uniref:helix-turn-helix transcriptional regulator n=1 Tax=Acrocarpospora catenulata TaxID=2836182 RepID=UPI001BDB29EC|nr:WYL domain-containing protein [Acrocarpospora catenulata]
MERPQRLLALLVALQAGRQMTADDLAAQFGVSKRTILRDVGALTAADVPVVAERGRYGGITLLPGAGIDVGRLTDTEAEVLEVFGIDVRRARQLGIEVAARSAAQKLAARKRRPAPGRDEARLPLADVVTIDDTAWFAPREPAELAQLVRDIRSGNRLRILYQSSGRRVARERTVDPYGVSSRGGRWYLIADVDGRPRMFALARLRSWSVLDSERRIRPDVALADVVRELVAALEDRHEVIVTALLDADREDIARRILGSRLRTVDATDDPTRIRLTVGYEQLDGVRQLLQFSDHIEITHPSEARALIATLAGRIAARHDSPGHGTTAESP